MIFSKSKYKSKVSVQSTEHLIHKKSYYISKMQMCRDYKDTMLGKSYLGTIGAQSAINECVAKIEIINQELHRRSYNEDY